MGKLSMINSEIIALYRGGMDIEDIVSTVEKRYSISTQEAVAKVQTAVWEQKVTNDYYDDYVDN